MNFLIKYFIKKPLLVNLITFFILFTGLWTLNQTRKEGYPTVDQKMIRIMTSYPGASPEDVELNVTIPIEKALKGIDGIEKYNSYSYENYSMIWVHIDKDYSDPEKVKSDVRSAVDNITDFPEEVTKRPDFWEWKTSNFTIFQIGIYSDTLSEAKIRRRTMDLEKKILTSAYVSKIESQGLRDREVHVKIDLNRLNKYYLSFEEIINAIKSHNVQITGGTLDSYTSEKTIVTLSKFKEIMDVKNVIIRSSFEGHRIALKDIAKIEDTFEERYKKIRFNGRTGMSLEIKKKEKADIIKTVDSIKKIVKEYKKSLKGEDIHFTFLYDMSEETRTRLGIVQNNAIIGLIMVLITLFIFLNFKNALWTSIGIPFSVCFAILFFPLFNITINSVSLLGLIVVLGMIVDDAIIVSENIFRYRMEGTPGLEAGIRATQEVSYPVITTIITTIIAFSPIFFIPGMMGDFAREIPYVIILILMGSLVESLFLLPNHVTHSFKKAVQKVEEKKFITNLKDKYSILLEKVLRWRYFVIGFFILAAALTFYALFFVMKFEMFPDVDAKFFELHGKVKNNKSLEYTSDTIKKLEQFVLKTYDEKTVKSFVSHIGSRGHPEQFRMYFYLKPDTVRTFSSDEIINSIKKEINRINLFTNIIIEKDTGGPPTGRALEVHIMGNDNKKREEISNKVEKYLESINGVFDIDRSDFDKKEEIKVYPKYNYLAQLGVTALNIAKIIKIAYEGLIVTDIQTPDELINYRVMLDDSHRRKIKTLNQLQVQNNQLKLVPILQMVNIEEGDSPTVIGHYNGDRTTRISADVDSKKITPKEIYTKINKDFKNFEYEYPGFRIKFGGEAEESMKTYSSLISSAIFAVIGIFLILILLFKSFSQPVMVLFAIPFGFIGVYIGFIMHGMVLGMMALLGVIGLSGVVVNDSLVMVEYINILKRNNPKKPLKQIIIQGAKTRLRPIILTTVTTVVGLFPTAYGIGGKDFMLVPTTMALSWGLIFATTLTLFLIPSLYLVEVDIRHFLIKFWKRLLIKLKIKNNF